MSAREVWEYQIVRVEGDDVERLNAEGADGWELVTRWEVEFPRSVEVRYLMKRKARRGK